MSQWSSGRERGGTPSTRDIAQVNKTAIVDLLRTEGVASKQDLCRLTGLSIATVNRLVAALQTEGIVTAAGTAPSSGGRPAVLLRYSGRGRTVAGVQLHADRAEGVLFDFEGRIVFRDEIRFPVRSPHDPEAVQAVQIDQVIELARRLIARGDEAGTRCLAIGVAVPGTVTVPAGVVSRTPELGWDRVPLGALLRSPLGLPVVVENDANALAFGEMRRGAGVSRSSLVALYLDRGFGAGIITNGDIHRGARAEAGEIGYLLVDRSALSRSYDEHGDLEDRIGAKALTRQARASGWEVPEGELITAEVVFRQAALGEGLLQVRLTRLFKPLVRLQF